MRVDDRILKNVTFVGLESDRGFTPLGTGFLGILAVADMHLCFLITAAHVIEKIRGDTFSIRVNLTSGGCVTTKIKKSDQIVHTDPNADIAMFSVTVEPSIHDVSLMPLDRSMSDQLRTTWKPGVGDEVVIVGAYTTHHGLMRNIPVARMGNIAQMPEEPVRTHAGHVVAYLV